MNAKQWETLLAVVRGEAIEPIPVGFVIDSPWLPNWAGRTVFDYFASDEAFWADNVKALETFPDALMLPGFWSEYGMCTEPSAFGGQMVWGENDFPSPRKLLQDISEVSRLEVPDPRIHGLLPFVVHRLRRLQPSIEAAGHAVRFAVARGPFNIASFLLGTTEFLMALRSAPDQARALLAVVTDFLVDWIKWQRECFPTIDGVFVLDDMIGFVGPKDFAAFALPSLARVFDTDVSVKFLHNDAPCKTAAPFLADIGVNLLNFGVQHTLDEMRAWTGGRVALLGNVPPRDVLAAGTPADVERSTREILGAASDHRRLIVSCGGGMAPGTPTANIRALMSAVEAFSRQRAGS